jgi:hypothetical protein
MNEWISNDFVFIVGYYSSTYNEIFVVCETLEDAEEYEKKIKLAHCPNGADHDGFYILRKPFIRDEDDN